MVHDDVLSAVLGDFARTVVTEAPVHGIADHLVDRVVALLDITGAGATLLSEDRAVQYVTASDPAVLRLEHLQGALAQGPARTAWESGRPVEVPDTVLDARYPRFGPAAGAEGMGAVFTFPLRHGVRCLGTLDLYRHRSGPLPDADATAAELLADVAATYLLNARARESALATSDGFRASALHDPLTGLPNRVLLQQRLDTAVRRTGTAPAVLFLDLDRFKQVNDTYGHATGDALLVAVAGRLSGQVRPGDTLARVSGDEFVLLCEDVAGPAAGDRLVARLHEAFHTPFAVSGVELTVTASVGIAHARSGQTLPDQLLTAADAAMYRVKGQRVPQSVPQSVEVPGDRPAEVPDLITVPPEPTPVTAELIAVVPDATAGLLHLVTVVPEPATVALVVPEPALVVPEPATGALAATGPDVTTAGPDLFHVPVAG